MTPDEPDASSTSDNMFPNTHMAIGGRGLQTAIYDLLIYKLDKRCIPKPDEPLHKEKQNARQLYTKLKNVICAKSDLYRGWFAETVEAGAEGDREQLKRARFLATLLVEFREAKIDSEFEERKAVFNIAEAEKSPEDDPGEAPTRPKTGKEYLSVMERWFRVPKNQKREEAFNAWTDYDEYMTDA